MGSCSVHYARSSLRLPEQERRAVLGDNERHLGDPSMVMLRHNNSLAIELNTHLNKAPKASVCFVPRAKVAIRVNN